MMTENSRLFAILCIDAVQNDASGGRFYYGDLSAEYAFSRLDRFFLAVDNILDGGAPDLPARQRENEAVWYSGKIATFKVQILYRRNAGWQGSVMWLETRHEEQFRSELELMSIIHQALIPAQKQRMCPSSLKTVK